MDEYDRRLAESVERAEERRMEDNQHRRETRAITLVSLTVIIAVTFLLLMSMRACGAGADREHETEMACVAAGGSWKGSSGHDPGECEQGKDRNADHY